MGMDPDVCDSKGRTSLRNNIQAASNFVCWNHLPPRLKEQILAYMCLRFRAETLNQQQLMEQLPNSICKSIYQYLFLPIVEQVYLFKGVSRELLLLLVTYMRAEYISPREDVIMQNETSCDFYILVFREIEIISCHMDKEMVLEALKSGDMFGEISALCNRPQSFTVRTKTKEVFSLFINKVNCADSIVGDAKVRAISGGEKKRLSVACKLIASPSVIFADEPTTGCFGHNKYIYFFNTSNSA